MDKNMTANRERERRGSKAMEGFEDQSQGREFVLDMQMHWEPMKGCEKRHHMILVMTVFCQQSSE